MTTAIEHVMPTISQAIRHALRVGTFIPLSPEDRQLQRLDRK